MKNGYVAAVAGLISFLSSVDSQSISTLAPACPLSCEGDAPCVRGKADFTSFVSIENSVPFLQGSDVGGYYCQCPAGRTGLLCEREYESCDDGAHFCFHGGKCLSGIKDASGVGQHYCDCGNAEFDGKSYAGEYCEAEAVEVCGNSVESGLVFCTNGGKCRDNYVEFLDQPCVCQDSFEGPHCEYHKGQMPGCDLMCENGGHCRIGSKDYSQNHAYREFWKTHDENRYCVCKPGYFGLQCEIQGQRCGEEHCFNGATCVSRDMGDGTTREFCDCTTASDRGASYAGLRCESESTSFCTKLPDHNGHQFCVNGGQCRMDSHLGCDCLEGFNGPICEFRDSVTNDTECNLKCKHNGVCRHGAKDVGFLKKFNVDIANLDMSVSTNFEHCVCPKGYVGLQCEHRVEVCPGGESICMNGASCIPDDSDGRLKYKCNCDSIHTPFHKYAGDFCELRSTDLCTLDGNPGMGLNRNAFCVNGGQCRDHVGESQEHPGCTCPSGFEGEHCQDLSAERKNDIDPADNQTIDDENRNGGLSTAVIILVVLLVSSVILAIGGYTYRKWHDCHRDVEGRRGDQSLTNLMARDAPKPPTMENALSMGSFQCGSESQLDSSCDSQVSNMEVDDGIYKVEEKGKDLVNVAII